MEFSNATKLNDVSAAYSQIDDSYIYSHIMPGSDQLSKLVCDAPLKISGTLLLLMRAGSPVRFEINLEEYDAVPGSLITVFPGNVLKINGAVPRDVEMYALFFDVKFLQSVNINLVSVAIPPTLTRPAPVRQLNREEADIVLRYFDLLNINTHDHTNAQLSKSIATSLMAALFYQMVQFYHRSIAGELDRVASKIPSGRSHDYVREFMRLVHLHYLKERSVSYYADRLFISPKYLSLLVRKATGRSAARWIDDFVIMEAKNMLRFSGKNIQQVAYALNFPTQSSFGKYFKHLTGMSPTDYQKS